MASPPPPSPPPPFYEKTVTDSQVSTTAWLSAVAVAATLIGYGILRELLRQPYVKRVQIPSLAARPPPLPRGGWHSFYAFLQLFFSYFIPIFALSDADLIRTAGMDALMFMRFLVLGVHMFLPLSILGCAVLLPVYATGDGLQESGNAGVDSLMKYTLSNISQGSSVLWLTFISSYVVLLYAFWVLFVHYQSYAILRIAWQRFYAGRVQDVPRMAIVGAWTDAARGRAWKNARVLLLGLLSPLHMHRADQRYVESLLQEAAALEARVERAGTGGESSTSGPPPCVLFDDVAHGEVPEAVLPWWLEAEEMPPHLTPEGSSSAVLPGTACCVLRQRALATGQDGQHVWAAAGLYTVLFTIDKSAPDTQLSPLLRPYMLAPRAFAAAALSSTVSRRWSGTQDGSFTAATTRRLSLVGSALDEEAGEEGGSAAEGEGSNAADGSQAGHSGKDDGGKAKCWRFARCCRWPQRARRPPPPTPAQRAIAAGAQLEATLRRTYPGSFRELVFVYDHRAVDKLLSQWDRVQAQLSAAREHLAAAQRGQERLGLAALARAGAEGVAAAEAEAGKAAARCGCFAKAGGDVAAAKAGVARQRAAKRVSALEERIAGLEASAVELEGAIQFARHQALASPVPTAFFAVFDSQSDTLAVAHSHLGLLPSAHYRAQPAPSPDNINWQALWSTYWGRVVRGLLSALGLTCIMLFPIGVLTGALTNLPVAVCNPGSDVYWDWFCDSDAGSTLIQNIFTGILPVVISTSYMTVVLPICFYLLAQVERRHVSLSALDVRGINLFFGFDVANTFIGAVLGGAFFSQLGAAIRDPSYIWTQLGTSLPGASNWVINYTILNGSAMNALRIIWPHAGTGFDGVWHGLRIRAMRPAGPRNCAFVRAAPSYRCPKQYGSFFAVMVMCLSYAVVSPIVMPCALLYFLLSWIVFRYMALYFFERSYESDGRLFECIFPLMAWTLWVYTFFTSAVLLSKQGYVTSGLLFISQSVIIALYVWYVESGLGSYVRAVPLPVALAAPRAAVDPAAYLAPPLRRGAVGWWPFWGLPWVKYGLPRYTL